MQVFHYALNPFLDLLTGILASVLNFLLEHKHLHHEFVVLDFLRILNVDSPQFHHVSGSLEVVEEGGFGLIDVGRVLDHVFLEEIF